MAALETDRLVVRVVYAGAPMAGKTASVRALMPLLKGPGAERLVMSPGEERGRTLFFDWADYEGGSFQGRPIHCQIASAPGQVALSDRRELILRGADAVILVVDSQSDGIERALQCYEEMAPWLEEAGQDAPLRLLLQCNKQDLAGALPPAQLSRALALDFGKDVYATSARTSKGLRAVFVAAVRAAVERARVLLERGLILGAAEIASGEELLERMQIEATLRESSAPQVPPAAPSQAPSAAAPRRAESARAARRAPAASAASSPRSSPRPAPAPAAAGRRAPARAGSARQGRRVVPDAKAGADAPVREIVAAGTAAPAEAPLAARAPTNNGRASARSARDSGARTRSGGEAPPELALRGAGDEAAPPRASAPAAAPSLARDWTPAKGPRPAVMPAKAFHALVGAAPDLATENPSSSPFTEPEVVSDDEWVDPTPSLRAPASLSSRAVHSADKSSVAKQRGARPAILPMSVYLASLSRSAPDLAGTPSVADGARVRATPVTAAPASNGAADSTASLTSAVRAKRAARPAIMPASAYRALLGPSAASDSTRPALQPSPIEASPSPTLEAGAATGAASAPPLARREISGSLRPAIMPASAWRARPPSASEASVAPSPAARHAWRAGARPAIIPASAWLAALAAAANDLEPESSSVLGHGGIDALPLSSAPPGASLAAPQPDAVTGAAEEPSREAPRLPGQVSPRSTWPRASWRQLAPLVSEQGAARRDALGRWIGEIAPGWYARTLESAPDLRSARRGLARAVLRQRALERYLSLPRCLALTEEADCYWVWQIVFRVPTLAGTLERLLDGGEDPGAAADALLEAALGYLDAREKFAQAPEALPLSLQELSSQAGSFVYAGLLPRSDAALQRPGPDEDAAFWETLKKRWPELPAPSLDARAIVAELERKADGRLPGPIVEIIRGVLIGQ